MYFDQTKLDQIQKTCDTFFTSTSDVERNQIHSHLLEYFDQNLTTEKVYEFKFILEKSNSAYAILLANNALIQVFSTKWTLINVDFRRSLYEYLIENLYLRAASYGNGGTERVIIKSFIQLLCKIIKTYYSDLDFNTKILDHFSKFFENFDMTTLIGIKILETLVQEMQFDEKSSTSTKFSRHIVDFKDHCLPKIIEVAFRFLTRIHNQTASEIAIPNTLEEDLRKSVLSLILESLKYDFLGIRYRMDDDFHEEFSPIMIPTRPNKMSEIMNWTIFRSEDIINIFFEIYLTSVSNNSAETCILSLKIINCLLRIKIEFFRSEHGQLDYIEFIIRGLRNILKMPLDWKTMIFYWSFLV